jgi:hypothetical protein
MYYAKRRKKEGIRERISKGTQEEKGKAKAGEGEDVFIKARKTAGSTMRRLTLNRGAPKRTGVELI